MDLATFLVQCLNAVQYGLLLFLVASGLTLIFGIMGVINLAHGSFYMLGAYLAFALAPWFGDWFFTRLAAGVVLAAVFGYVLEWAFFSFLYRRDHLQQVLLTYALILVFEELRSLAVGNDVHGVAMPEWLAGSFRLGELMAYPWYRVFASLACLVVALGLYLVVNKTRLGMMIRAGASDRDMARGLGVDIRKLYRIVFAGGVALAALAGMIAAPLSSVYPGMGSSVLIVCFVVVVIGGIGSIGGAFVAALLVGIVDTFGKVFFAEWSGVGVYVLMAVILIWRPEGLMSVAPEDAASSDARAEVGGLPDIARREPGGWLVPAALALVVAALPLLISPYAQDVVVRIAIYAIFALSLELIVGAAGLVSLGHAAFLGIGAYATVLASGDGAASLLLLVPLAVGSAAVYALVVGALSLRTRGVYFIMVTLAFAQMAYFVVHDTKVGGGSDGIFLGAKPTLTLGGRTLVDLGQGPQLYYAVLLVLVATYAFLALLLASRFGHALVGIRVNEQRMRAAGFSTTPYKLAAFVIAGGLAGLAGMLLAIKDGAVNPELLAWHESGAVLLMLILGGLGSLRGAVLGAVAFTLLKELFQSEALLGPLALHWQLTLGLTIIGFVAALPRGLIGLGRRWRSSPHR